jgi:hypothetical protein
MRARLQPLRRAKLPPILEIDEDGVPVTEFNMPAGRWAADADANETSLSLGEWPTEFDD